MAPARLLHAMPRRLPLAAVLALLLLVPAMLPGAAASDAVRPEPGSIWTVFTTVRATVEGNYAIVEVIADIGNRGPDPEFPFQVRVPDDALVTALTIERDGVVHHADIADREAARAQYEEHKLAQQTGALVEKTRRSDVYAYLVNVANFTSVRATLTYEQYLAADRGVYNLSLEAPVSGFGQDLGARFETRVVDADNAWGSPTADVTRTSEGFVVTRSYGPRATSEPTPWQLSYTLDPTAETGSLLTTIHNGTGYFAHRFRAAPDAERLPLDLVLVLDTSGSMGGLKIEQLRDAAAQVVRMLGPQDRLHLAPFSSDVSAPWQGLRAMTPDARRAAVDEVAALLAAGGTNIGGGLARARDVLAETTPLDRETRMQVVVLLSDGQPTAGETRRDALRDLARDVATTGAMLGTIAFGADADWPLLYALAGDGGGTALRVPEGAGAEVDITRFLTALTTPILKDVRIDYGEGVTARNTGAAVLLAGSELLVVGTFDPALGVTGTLHATGPDGARTHAFAGGTPRELPWLPRLVAYHEVRHLQDLLDTQGDPHGERLARLKTLALDHGFVTDHTSLVLTLAAREMTNDDIRMRLALQSGDATPGTWTANHGYAALGSTPPTPTTSGDRWALDDVRSHEGTTHTDATPEAEVPAPGVLGALIALAMVGATLRRRKP